MENKKVCLGLTSNPFIYLFLLFYFSKKIKDIIIIIYKYTDYPWVSYRGFKTKSGNGKMETHQQKQDKYPMGNLFKSWLLHEFKSYPEWDVDLQEEARELVVHEYVQSIYAGSADQMLEDLKWEIKMDLQLFEADEQYEVCQLLRDIQQELG